MSASNVNQGLCKPPFHNCACTLYLYSYRHSDIIFYFLVSHQILFLKAVLIIILKMLPFPLVQKCVYPSTLQISHHPNEGVLATMHAWSPLTLYATVITAGYSIVYKAVHGGEHRAQEVEVKSAEPVQ